MKYSAYAECEIIHFVNCEISPFGRCEIKFASSHLRSKYFTAELFHMAKPYFTRRRRISLNNCGRYLVKYSAYAECEIIHFVNCEISPFGRCEIKFASSYLRSKYFTAELFHMAKPYFTRRGRISLNNCGRYLVKYSALPNVK